MAGAGPVPGGGQTQAEMFSVTSSAESSSADVADAQEGAEAALEAADAITMSPIAISTNLLIAPAHAVTRRTRPRTLLPLSPTSPKSCVDNIALGITRKVFLRRDNDDKSASRSINQTWQYGRATPISSILQVLLRQIQRRANLRCSRRNSLNKAS